MTDLQRLDALRRAAECLCQSEDGDVRQVGEAMTEWLAGGAADPLDRALALRTRGGVSPSRAIALADRDRLLRDLHRNRWGDLDAGAAARVMARSFFDYETRRWKRERHALGAPSGEPAATWWRILVGEVAMPKVPRLRQILSANEIQSGV